MPAKPKPKAPRASRAATARTQAAAKAKAPAKPRSKAAGKSPRSAKATKAASGARKKVVLLSGGNPQIAKADGDAPVQAYIAAMPGGKRDVGKRLDALIVRTVPHVQKAVKWNSPFYGVEGKGWFLAFHTYANYVKVSFFRGGSLRPPPPVPSKQRDVRYVHLHEGEAFDDALASWIKQAAALPGWTP